MVPISSQRSLRLLQILAICLSTCWIVNAVVQPCRGRPWWILTDQRVSVLSPSIGQTRAFVNFTEVYLAGSANMTRQTELKGRHMGWRKTSHWLEVFSDREEYRVLARSQVFVRTTELGALKRHPKELQGNLTLGRNRFEEGKLRYEYEARVGGIC